MKLDVHIYFIVLVIAWKKINIKKTNLVALSNFVLKRKFKNIKFCQVSISEIFMLDSMNEKLKAIITWNLVLNGVFRDIQFPKFVKF